MIFTITNIEIHLCFHAIISYANISTIKIYDLHFKSNNNYKITNHFILILYS